VVFISALLLGNEMAPNPGTVRSAPKLLRLPLSLIVAKVGCRGHFETTHGFGPRARTSIVHKAAARQEVDQQGIGRI